MMAKAATLGFIENIEAALSLLFTGLRVLLPS
jgi:hypothetical protein